jgi:fructose-1,6-bisphosphatase/inositol monophosphatase family enzyme
MGNAKVKHNMFDMVGEILRETAAAVVMPRFAALQPGDILMKAANDPVTIADREAEAMIDRALQALLPSARIVGEEACATNPALLDDLGEGTVWIVDPIDGTANFAAGRAPFAMMIALLEQGELAGSWIFDPLRDRLSVAQRGGGAWIDGERLCTDVSPIGLSELNGIVSEAFLPPAKQGLVDGIRAAVGSTVPSARCAGHEYPLVATGARQFALYWRTLVWDHAPGALLLTEAGGSVTCLDGTPYDPCRSKPGLLLAYNPAIARELISLTTS